MTEDTGGGARWTIPWVALIFVAIFAFMQLDAAQRARGKLAKVRDDLQAIEAGAVVNQTDLPRANVRLISAREHSLDEQLSKEQAAHRKARARVDTLEAQLAAERARADKNDALRATEKARADALERHRKDVSDNLARTKALLEKGQALTTSDPVKRWLDDAASGDKARVAYAMARASEATSEQIAALGRLLKEASPAKLKAAARLTGALPRGGATSALVGDILLERTDAVQAGVIAAVPRERLLDAVVFERLLAHGSPMLRAHLLVLGAQHGWSVEDRERIGAVLLKQLAADDAEALSQAAKALAYFGIEGGAKRLGALLDHTAPGVRAAAAYGLRGVPDRKVADAEARAAVPGLLDDDVQSVRLAGALLAEALLGAPVTFDVNASRTQRAASIQEIKRRLGL